MYHITYNCIFLKYKIKYRLITFKELKDILHILNSDYNDKNDIFKQHVYDNFICNKKDIPINIINHLDYLIFLYDFIIESFDKNIEFSIACTNKKCMVDIYQSIEIKINKNEFYKHNRFGKFIFENLNIDANTIKNMLYTLSNKGINYFENELTNKEYKIKHKLLTNQLTKVYNIPIIDLSKQIVCKFCSTKLDVNYLFYSLNDLIFYINRNYNLIWYKDMVMLMKRFNYSVNEINDMYLGELNFLYLSELKQNQS